MKSKDNERYINNKFATTTTFKKSDRPTNPSHLFWFFAAAFQKFFVS